MRKEISSTGETYGLAIEASGRILERVESISLKVPDRKPSVLERWLGFDEAMLSASGMSYDEFKNRFPEGKYIIYLLPWYGKFSVEKTYDFPEVAVTYPLEGEVGVPIKPTIQWEPMGGIDTLSLKVETEWGYYSIGLDPESSSFTPYWTLDPNTAYTLYLEATRTDSQGNDTVTTFKVSFTTGS